MTLTRYGLREWLTSTIIVVALAGGFIWLGWWWMVFPLAIIWLAIAAFFRDPHRMLPQSLPPGTMLSPADGRVSKVLTVDHHEATDGPAVIIRIFLSLLDVHINRAPCNCIVIAIKHTPGRYLDARTDESAEVNESNLITLSFEDGERFGVRQVSGKVARRIVCPIDIGHQLRRGQRFGMIKFGSTTELILPRPNDVRVHVSVGEKVRGGLTMLATMMPPSPVALQTAGDQEGDSMRE